jgi:hypothetical protein
LIYGVSLSTSMVFSFSFFKYMFFQSLTILCYVVFSVVQHYRLCGSIV